MLFWLFVILGAFCVIALVYNLFIRFAYLTWDDCAAAVFFAGTAFCLFYGAKMVSGR
jgi:hypothetical protein